MKNKKLRINVLTDRMEEDRYGFISFQSKLKPSDPQWFYIQGKINILTDLLYFYYSETSE